MTDYDISDVTEIKVELANGRSLIYRDTGLNVIINKIRSLRSPGTGARETTIIDSDDYEVQEDDIPPPSTGGGNRGQSQPRGRGRGATPTRGGTNGGSNGYNALSVSYVAPKGGRSPMELAKEMQRTAEETTGVKY